MNEDDTEKIVEYPGKEVEKIRNDESINVDCTVSHDGRKEDRECVAQPRTHFCTVCTPVHFSRPSHYYQRFYTGTVELVPDDEKILKRTYWQFCPKTGNL